MLRETIALGLLAAATVARSETVPADGSSSSVESTETVALAPWQNDYGEFVEAYRRCAADTSCNVREMLAGKPVTWEGTVSGTPSPHHVLLEMWPDRPKVTDTAGITRTLVCCNPNLGSLDGWMNTKPGRIVRFSAKLEAGESWPPVMLFGAPGEAAANPPRWVRAVGGPVALIQLTQAKLLSAK